jgi:hypothetical protein
VYVDCDDREAVEEGRRFHGTDKPANGKQSE